MTRFLLFLGLVVLLQTGTSTAMETFDHHETFNFTVDCNTDKGEEDFIYILDDETHVLNITIYQSKPGTLRLMPEDFDVFKLINETDYTITSNTEFPLKLEVIIKGKFLGVVDLQFYLLDSEGWQKVGTFIIKVGKSNRALNDVFTYALLAWLCISYITMGTKMELSTIWSKLRRPWAVLIGIGCQFFVMPALAFGLANLFQLDDETAVGLVLDGTCPGGWFSNIFSLLLDLDIVLSLTMTFMSTFLALGMMPLNLLIYATPYTGGNDALQTPFVELFFQMFLLLVPVGFGMLVTYKFERVRKILEFLAKPCACVLLLIALIVGLPSSIHVFLSPWQIWIASATFPLMGCLLGFIIAKLACIPTRSAVTVALETGAQNSLMARTMIDLFYPLPEGDLIGRVPTLISILTMVEGIIVIIIVQLWKRFCKKLDEEEKKALADEDGVEVIKNELTNGIEVDSVALKEKQTDIDVENGHVVDQNGSEKHIVN